MDGEDEENEEKGRKVNMKRGGRKLQSGNGEKRNKGKKNTEKIGGKNKEEAEAE